MRDPYEVLGIQRGATDDEIKKAYRAKCKRWHPDLNPNDPTAEEHFKEVQAAYDAITKGDTGPQMGGQPGGGYGYGQQGYYQGGYQQGYDQGYSQNGWQQGDFGFGFDPFGFGFGFGGYQQQSGASYSGSDTPEMQAARNFVANGRYAEARRVLDGMNSRSARWYYLSSLANQGLGNSIDALQDARRAVQLDPNNTEYQMHLRRMQNPGQTYRTQTTYAQPGGLMRWCWSMILLNLLCNCCCGGGWGWRFRMPILFFTSIRQKKPPVLTHRRFFLLMLIDNDSPCDLLAGIVAGDCCRLGVDTRLRRELRGLAAEQALLFISTGDLGIIDHHALLCPVRRPHSSASRRRH